ncbi:MAG: efflux RND transporter permease subunit [Balneolales bacterium]
MKIVETSINNRTGIVVLTLLLIIAGATAYVTIPKEANPSVEIPMFIVTTIYPGIGPSDMESLITQPLERELQGINGIEEITSTTLESVSMVIVEFGLDIALTEASQRVRERVGLARNDLPTDAEDPIITEIDIDDFPIMTINLAGNYPLSRLTDTAERLQDVFETVSGVREVNLIGGIEREVQVDVNLASLNGHNISFNQIMGAIQQQNVTIPGGNVDVNRLRYLLRISGEFDDPKEIEDLVISPPEGGGPEDDSNPGVIYIRDLADVIFGFEERQSFSRLTIWQEVNGDGTLNAVPDDDIIENQVVSLNILKRPGANILETAGGINEALSSFAFPEGTQILITGDQSDNIDTLITDLENSIISGMLFVILVLVFFLGARNALLVGTAVPLSIFVGFIVLQLMGQTVNFIILFSLIIALGLLVDNSIVVVENIYRYLEQGYGRFEAAQKATSEVGYALIASTLTLLAAFAPMLFWPGIIGQFMSYLPMTLIIVLTCSLFVALVIYPVLTALVVKLENEEKAEKGKLSKWIGVILLTLTALIIGIINPITLAVTIASGLVIYGLYHFLIEPASLKFTTKSLPKIVISYQDFLKWMLIRDYSSRRSLLRNSFSLGCFTMGILLLIMGGMISTVSETASYILLVPGGVLLALGILGIIIHTLETIILGRKISVFVGLILALFILLVNGLNLLGGTEIDFNLLLVMLSLPIFLIVLGLIGITLKKEKNLILTDHRALLVNSTFGVLFVIIAGFTIAPTGVTFFPEGEPGQLVVNIEGPIGMNIETSNKMVKEIQNKFQNLMETNPESKANVENVLVNVGISGGGPFGGSGLPQAEMSRITINMVDFGERKEPSSQTMAKVRQQLQGIPDALIQIDQEQMGPPTGPPVNIEISGEDFTIIQSITREINSMLKEASETGTIPGLVDVRDNISGGLPEYRILINHEKAIRSGISLADIAQTIRFAMNGFEVGSYRDGEDEYDIIIRLREEDRSELESLENLMISNMSGDKIPLVSVAEFVDGSGLGSITRLNLRRTATVEGQVSPGFSANEVLVNVQEMLDDYQANLPTGYSMEYTGENQDQEESFGFLTTALLVGFALIFFVMLVKFNSLKAPFIILIAVGLSLTGVLAGLMLTRTLFSLMTFIGIISLAGIVCINNIVLVDYIKQLLDQGKSKTDAIIEAGGIRFRPVMLTALTTILGLVPLTFGINIDFVGLFASFDPNFQLGSENSLFWGPMGIAIISGLTFATFLTLVIVPVLYSVFDSLSTRLGKAW